MAETAKRNYYCPVCTTYEISREAKFCATCGGSLTGPPPEMECSNCHGEVKATDKWCIHCGMQFI